MLGLSLSQIPCLTSKRVESIRIQNHWKLRLTDKRSNEPLRFLRSSDSRANGQKSLALQKGMQTTSLAIRRGDRAHFGGS